jgi:hypothetical protein
MKKVILIFAALILVASGVAAVSAYEAHVINVKAHVENALTVNTDNVDFGTVFPQEFIKYHRNIRLSDSANATLGAAAGDLKTVTVQVYAEWKAEDGQTAYWDNLTDGWQGPYDDYYNWMGDFLWVGFDPSQDPDPVSGMVLVGPALAPPPSAQPILATVNLTDAHRSTQLGIAVDVPVFEGHYNDLTDPDPKPSGLNDPSYIIPDGSMKYTTRPKMPGYDPEGMDFGIDLKVQVIKIVRVP